MAIVLLTLAVLIYIIYKSYKKDFTKSEKRYLTSEDADFKS